MMYPYEIQVVFSDIYRRKWGRIKHYFLILAKWKEYYNIEDVKFYC